jgi:hypothetical protein
MAKTVGRKSSDDKIYLINIEFPGVIHQTDDWPVFINSGCFVGVGESGRLTANNISNVIRASFLSGGFLDPGSSAYRPQMFDSTDSLPRALHKEEEVVILCGTYSNPAFVTARKIINAMPHHLLWTIGAHKPNTKTDIFVTEPEKNEIVTFGECSNVDLIELFIVIYYMCFVHHLVGLDLSCIKNGFGRRFTRMESLNINEGGDHMRSLIDDFIVKNDNNLRNASCVHVADFWKLDGCYTLDDTGYLNSKIKKFEEDTNFLFSIHYRIDLSSDRQVTMIYGLTPDHR